MRLLNKYLKAFARQCCRTFVLATAVLCLGGREVIAQEASMPFHKGEVITYSIKKMGIKAGEATLTFHGAVEVKNQPAYLIVFKADGFNFYDEEKIYVHATTFTPLKVERDLNIFGNKERITEEYLSSEGKVVIVKTVDGKSTTQVLEKSGTLDNIYGVIYRYRKEGSFQLGDEVALRLPTQDVKLKLREMVKLSTAGQKFNAFFVSSVPSKYQIWFDVGEKKIPLRIIGAVGMANTAMSMIRYVPGS